MTNATRTILPGGKRGLSPFALLLLIAAGWIFSGFPLGIKTAEAAPPTFVAAGASAASTGAITPGLPAGIAVNDILLLFLETSNQAITIANASGGTWAQVLNSPQPVGTPAGADGARLTVFWSRYNGTQTAPVTSDSGNYQLGIIIAVRGVVTTGNPWDVTAGGVEAGNLDTSGAIPGATTSVADTLIVAAIATALPDSFGTSAFSAWANADLTSVTERADNSTGAGNGAGLGVATGVKAAAGAYGATTVTVSVNTAKSMMSIALMPAPPPATLSSAANQTFTLGDPPTLASVLTVTDDTGTPTITATNDLRIRIPATFNMTWDTAVTTVTLGGGAAGKVSATLAAYEDSNRTAVLNVTSNFAASDQLTIAGLKFHNFTAASAADNLELVVAGTGGTTAAADDKTITIVNSNVSSAGSRILNDNAGRTPVAAEDVDVTNWDKNTKFLVTIGIQTGGTNRCELNQLTNKLQWRNVTDAPGTWNNLGTAAGPEMILFNSANLVDNNALTSAEAQIGGPGAYINGKEAENNNDKTWGRFENGEHSAIQFAIDPSAGITGKTYQFRFIVTPLCDAGTNVMSVSITLAVPPPSLVFMKTVSVTSDPVNGTTNPKNIPGAEVLYNLRVTNTGAGVVDNNTLVMVDPLPANTELFVGDLGAVGSGPIVFVEGTPTSNLTRTFTSLASLTDDVDFSNDNGATWTYVPTPPYDTAVNRIRLNPKGTMAGASGSNPFFELRFRVRVK